MGFAALRLLLLLPLLLCDACHSRDLQALEDCRAAYARGERPPEWENPKACGCGLTVCRTGEICYYGVCCNPGIEDCGGGCQQTCPDGSECFKGKCCSPDGPQGELKESCGCRMTCENDEWVSCDQKAGERQCVCDPAKAYGSANCGCRGPCPKGRRCEPVLETRPPEKPGDPPQRVIVNHQCKCDPSNDDNRRNDTDCYCTGKACASGTQCVDGVCRCRNANEVRCPDECVLREACQCDKNRPPPWALQNRDNCGCRGPCPPGERCLIPEGQTLPQCTCDPVQHLFDNRNCGCGGACGDGFECVGGQCRCSSYNLNNAKNCNCEKDCTTEDPKDPDRICRNGKCTCDPARHKSDRDNCFCGGVCNASWQACDGGCRCLIDKCRAEPGGKACYVYDRGKKYAKCTSGPCFNAICECDEDQHKAWDNCGCDGQVNDQPDRCGCPAVRCGDGKSCDTGVCVCKNTTPAACGCPAKVCDRGQICIGGNCMRWP